MGERNGADWNFTGNTPLHLAMESGHGEAAAILIEAGADRERVSLGDVLVCSAANRMCSDEFRGRGCGGDYGSRRKRAEECSKLPCFQSWAQKRVRCSIIKRRPLQTAVPDIASYVHWLRLHMQ
jgi:hypothetical protein